MTRALRCDSCSRSRHLSFLCCMFSPIMTSANWSYCTIGSRSSGIMFWIVYGNMARAKIIVNCSFIFRLSVLNMGFNKSRQNKKFVYWPSSYSLPVLNMTSKQRSGQVMKLVNCLSHAEYGLQKRLAPVVMGPLGEVLA